LEDFGFLLADVLLGALQRRLKRRLRAGS